MTAKQPFLAGNIAKIKAVTICRKLQGKLTLKRFSHQNQFSWQLFCVQQP